MDFSGVKIHCSSLGHLFTEPKLKSDKDAGRLSETAKTHLIKVYAKLYWKRERRLETKQMAKGVQQEKIGIELIGEIHGHKYQKNTIVLDNEYIIGTPDVLYVPKKLVVDCKLSWDSDTFLPNLTKPLDPLYFYQLQGYLWLSGFDLGKVSYALVDATEQQIMDEQRKVFYQMGCLTEESPEYLEACADIEKQMTYGDIPKHERVWDKTCDRDDTVIAQIPAKVKRAREFLQEFHELHTKTNQRYNIEV